MKAILFVILNVSVGLCFPRASVGVEILIPGGFGGRTKKNLPGSLSLAMTPLQHTYNFYLASAILELYIWFPFPHITAVDMSFCTSLRNFIQIGPPSAEKNGVMSIFKLADLRLSHLGLYGSNNVFFEKPSTLSLHNFG